MMETESCELDAYPPALALGGKIEYSLSCFLPFATVIVGRIPTFDVPGRARRKRLRHPEHHGPPRSRHQQCCLLQCLHKEWLTHRCKDVREFRGGRPLP